MHNLLCDDKKIVHLNNTLTISSAVMNFMWSRVILSAAYWYQSSAITLPTLYLKNQMIPEAKKLSPNENSPESKSRLVLHLSHGNKFSISSDLMQGGFKFCNGKNII